MCIRDSYIIKDWTSIDLSSLGVADSISFTVASSDIGQFGINTPTYICIDNVRTNAITTTNVETVAIEEWVQVFPNPSVDFIQLKKRSTEPLTLSLFSLQGQQLLSSELVGDQILDIRSLERGTYLLHLSQGNQQASQLLMKQ